MRKIMFVALVAAVLSVEARAEVSTAVACIAARFAELDQCLSRKNRRPHDCDRQWAAVEGRRDECFTAPPPALPPGPRASPVPDDLNERANKALRDATAAPRGEPPAPVGRSNSPGASQEPDPRQVNKSQDPSTNPPSVPGEKVVLPNVPVTIVPSPWWDWERWGLKKPSYPWSPKK